jgi:predicted transcriptional regulator
MSTVSDSDEILSRLFGSVSRARILEFLLSQSGRAFYQREIMYETGLTLQPTQRELKNLLDLGIIKKKRFRDVVKLFKILGIMFARKVGRKHQEYWKIGVME